MTAHTITAARRFASRTGAAGLAVALALGGLVGLASTASAVSRTVTGLTNGTPGSEILAQTGWEATTTLGWAAAFLLVGTGLVALGAILRRRI